MKTIIGYVRAYFQQINRKVLVSTLLLCALFIFINYQFGIESRLRAIDTIPLRIAGFYLLYLILFVGSYGLHFIQDPSSIPGKPAFYWLLLLSPLLFAFKIGFPMPAIGSYLSSNSQLQHYWNLVLDWPLRLLFLLIGIILVNAFTRQKDLLPGTSLKCVNLQPYFLLLLCMLPLLAFAASRPDFLAVYPKLQSIHFLYPHTNSPRLYQLLYEIAYGLDFFSIEFFFRGFLVLAFARYVGYKAVLTMAAFYCSIHFGKPLFECISSFPGGLILGAVIVRTRSIWGGLIVHLGIAWLMELAGMLGHWVIQ